MLHNNSAVNGLALLATTVASMAMIQPHVQATTLLFTETSPTSITVTVDGAFYEDVGSLGNNLFDFRDNGWVTPPSTYGAFWQTWERKDGTYIDVSMGRQAPHDAFPVIVTVQDTIPTFPDLVLQGPVNAPNPIVPDGTIVSTAPAQIVGAFGGYVTEVGFIDLTDTATIPDTA